MGELLLHTSELKPGMKLSKPLFYAREASVIMFPKNHALDEPAIEKAMEFGVGLAYVHDGKEDPKEDPAEILQTKTHSAADYKLPARAIPKKVLVVDDEMDICNYMKDIIEEKEHKVLTATSAMEAWDHLVSDPHISTVFLDIKMPEVNGFELLKVIKTQLPRPVEVVMVTASRSMQDVILANQLGARDFVMKPFKPERLIQALDGGRKQ